MKILMIDPWGVNNLSLYTNGLCMGISEYVDVTLFTNFYYEKTTEANYIVKPVFFPKSQVMKEGLLRTCVRGTEYLLGYRKILNELKKNKYDLVHIQWLLIFKLDKYILKEIKKYCKKIVYTAHDVIPHRNGENYINDLKEIYSIVDLVLVHGEGIKKEFVKYFPEYENKELIQRHGTYLNQDKHYDINNIDKKIIEKVQDYDRISIFFGYIFYNKGVDRLAKIWLDNFADEEKHLLIIAGKRDAVYKELDMLEKNINECRNILYINRFVENDLLNYLIDKSHIILLPYRHASMSGVVFTAAEFKKPVLATNTGSISEYLVDGESGFIVENDERLFMEKLKYIYSTVSNETLHNMGENLHEHIKQNYSWENIGELLAENVYGLEL